MPLRGLSLFSDSSIDTPPLSPSRSLSSISATRSSVASSNSSLNLGDSAAAMSKANSKHLGSYGSTESIDSKGASRKTIHDSLPYSGARERDIAEELDNYMDQEDNSQDRGRSGYEDHHHDHARVSRPSVPRQSSYSKRHASFDTPREVPFPCGYLASTANPLPNQPRDVQHERPKSTPIDSGDVAHRTGNGADTGASDGAINCPTNAGNDLPPRRPNFERSSSTSLPLPTSMPYSTLPPFASPESPPRYENPRPAPMIPHTFMNYEAQSSAVLPSEARPPITKMETYSSYPPPSRLPSQSPSPPLLAEEPDVTDPGPSGGFRSRFMHPPHDTNSRTSLPPPSKPASSMFASSSLRAISLPHSTNNAQSHSGIPSIPPPQPPTILTPPPRSADEESSRKPAPYEPFLSRGQPPADNTYIAVETVPSEYKLIVRLPGFQRDSITLSTRRRRILHVVADNWSDGGGHFERRISFGYDADLTSVRAEFDGEILKIIVPRRTMPGWFYQSTS